MQRIRSYGSRNQYPLGARPVLSRHRGSATGGDGGTRPPIFESAGIPPPIFRKIVGQIRRVFGFWYGLPSEENPGFAAAWSPSPHFHRRGGAPESALNIETFGWQPAVGTAALLAIVTRLVLYNGRAER